MSARSSIPRRSGVLIFRTSALKIALDCQLSNLGVQLLDLAFASVRALPPDTRVKALATCSSSCFFQA
ncbi:hypothetical protein [Bradyrhizobium sp. BRP22]|uniref:hypothetical protein n=1 Tax=Bradyrhizobium sp. BRP22 TaxID=2793821 RepID=UPI001CD3B5FE|nr:hypothetical protein [Bradyrhizobium sp. BRP22]